jgi:NAD(P)-dependent dehydrogenase (short-subunit alcohol dehydrogenase family)
MPGRHWSLNCALSAPRAEFVRADVRREDDVRNLVDKTVERFGRLDVAVNNAGTEGQPGPLTEQSAETYAATFDTNVLGTLLDVEIVRSGEAPGGVGEAGTAGVVRRLSTRSTSGAACNLSLSRRSIKRRRDTTSSLAWKLRSPESTRTHHHD